MSDPCSWCHATGFVGVVPCRECKSTGMAVDPESRPRLPQVYTAELRAALRMMLDEYGDEEEVGR